MNFYLVHSFINTIYGMILFYKKMNRNRWNDR